jgi:DNA-binding beta-propeller fold protein YncE
LTIRDSKLFHVYEFKLYLACLATDIVFSLDGTFVLVYNRNDYCIRKVDLKSGQISIFAGIPNVQGTKNGPKEQASFYCIRNLTFSPDGNFVLVCDSYTIRKICVKTGQVSTFAGICTEFGGRNGPKEQARFGNPSSITFSPDGTHILVCDYWNHCIRKICVKSGQVSVFAGSPRKKGHRNGSKEQALFESPNKLTFSNDGTYILMCDWWNNCIRKICVKTDQVSDFAGLSSLGAFWKDGQKEQAYFAQPQDVIFSPNGTC